MAGRGPRRRSSGSASSNPAGRAGAPSPSASSSAPITTSSTIATSSSAPSAALSSAPGRSGTPMCSGRSCRSPSARSVAAQIASASACGSRKAAADHTWTTVHPRRSSRSGIWRSRTRTLGSRMYAASSVSTATSISFGRSGCPTTRGITFPPAMPWSTSTSSPIRQRRSARSSTSRSGSAPGVGAGRSAPPARAVRSAASSSRSISICAPAARIRLRSISSAPKQLTTVSRCRVDPRACSSRIPPSGSLSIPNRCRTRPCGVLPKPTDRMIASRLRPCVAPTSTTTNDSGAWSTKRARAGESGTNAWTASRTRSACSLEGVTTARDSSGRVSACSVTRSTTRATSAAVPSTRPSGPGMPVPSTSSRRTRPSSVGSGVGVTWSP